MRVLCYFMVLLCLGASASAAVAPPPAPPLDPLLRPDPDGGRTFIAVLEDGVGGAYRHVPVTDAGIAAFTNALVVAGVSVAPVYSQDVKEVGAFAHSFSLAGVPYMTLGSYVRSESQGLVRVPVVMLENVSDLGAAALLLASVVGDDALPYAAEAIPHTYGLVAPDALPIVLLGAIGIALVAAAPLLAVTVLAAADGAQPLVNLPPELYAAGAKVGLDAFFLFFPLLFGPMGLPTTPGAQAPYAEDWVDRPVVRAWTVRKTAADHEAWLGTYLERTGSSNGGASNAFVGTKRVETGVASRVDGATTHLAGLYVQLDARRHSDADDLSTRARYTVGATAADAADAPLAAVEMEETRSDGIGNLHFLPASQRNDWRVGVYAGEEFVPLVGARTESTHDIHPDVNNLGQPVTEIETERFTSVGAYASGSYVPVLGARYWGERLPAELYVLFTALSGVGDQNVGDVEVSLGAFALGSYVPLVGARVDDDFALHHHPYRAMASVGPYALGAFTPVLAATYDGERPSTTWALAHAADGDAGDTRWQTSAGLVAAGTYAPLVGTRYEPHTHGAARRQQESYQIGVYPATYATFLPLLSVDYDGQQASPVWAQAIAGGAQGGAREGEAQIDLVAYAPDGSSVPVFGARHRPGAPDLGAAYASHVAVGVFQGGAFTPLAGASFGADAPPAGAVPPAALPPAHASVGPYVNGAYVPLARVDTPGVPLPAP